MITEEAHQAVVAENVELQRRVTALTEQLASALQRISDLEAKKTPPPSFVKANVPAVTTKRVRKPRGGAEPCAATGGADSGRGAPADTLSRLRRTPGRGACRAAAAGGRSAAARRRRGDGTSGPEGVVFSVPQVARSAAGPSISSARRARPGTRPLIRRPESRLRTGSSSSMTRA